MTPELREKLSLVRAKAFNLAGRPSGFFTQYDYAGSIDRNPAPYPAVEALCAASPYEEFLSHMVSHLPDARSFGQGALEPRWESAMLPPLDGFAAYTAVKTFTPGHIVEIGSGDSTYFLARGGCPDIVCIDPAPRREISQLPVHVENRVLANDDVDRCASLDRDDILFIDSSHIMLSGMDVDIEFNRIFPALKPGVLVHIHDIFLPFGYPTAWVERNWSEQHALVGWLFGSFDIVWPAHYVLRRRPELIDDAFAAFPVLTRKAAGSMWLRKR